MAARDAGAGRCHRRAPSRPSIASLVLFGLAGLGADRRRTARRPAHGVGGVRRSRLSARRLAGAAQRGRARSSTIPAQVVGPRRWRMVRERAVIAVDGSTRRRSQVDTHLRARRHAGRRGAGARRAASTAGSAPRSEIDRPASPAIAPRARGRAERPDSRRLGREHPPQHLADHRLRQVGAELDLSPAPCTAPAAPGSRPRSSSSVAAGPGFSTTQALATSPFIACGMPATPTSSTAGCAEMHFLDLARPDLEAARLDHVLLAIDEEDVAVLVHVGEVAGVQPRSAVAVRAAATRRSRAGCSSTRSCAAARAGASRRPRRRQHRASPSSASTMRTSTSGSGRPIEPIFFVPCTGLTQHAIMPSVSE